MRRKKNDHTANNRMNGTTHPSISGSQRLTTSPEYFTFASSSSSTSFGSSTRVVVNAVPPFSAFFNVPWMIVSPTCTSATWPPRTMFLKSLYEICRPAGARKYAWPMASSVSTPSTHHKAVGFGVDDCRRSLPPGGREGLGMDRLTFRKAQLVSSHVHRYGVALTERAVEHAQSKRIQQPPLQGPLERTSPINWIITLADQEVFRGVTELDRDFAVAEALQQPAQLNFDNLPDVFLLQRVEDHDLVDTVDELGTEVRAQRVLIAQVRGHRDHRVAEIHDAALAVGQPAVVEQLQHHVENFGMRLLNFVEQHHGVRAAAHGFGQLAGLVVADISGRRADHARHGVLLLVFRHVDANQRMLVVKQELRERARKLRLAHAGRAEEDEAAQRTIRILQAGPGAANGVAHRDDRF